MCGVAGVLGSSKASLEVFLGLSQLQHRGQDAAGICSFDPNIEPSMNTAKGLGLVSRAFTPEQMEQLQGAVAIGHTRYSTVGKKGDLRDIQPMVTNFPLPLAMCHNGNLVNYLDLKNHLKQSEGFSPLTGSDLEIIMRLFIKSLLPHIQPGERTASLKALSMAAEAVQNLSVGAYSVVGMLGDQALFGFCDPNGIRPLVFGRRKNPEGGLDAFSFASEDSVLNFLGFEALFDVQPGEFVAVNSQGEIYKKMLAPAPLKACMFEWVYFAGADSNIRGFPVYGARLQLGRALASVVLEKLNLAEIEIDIVSPVPETSRTAAIALAESIQRPYREALIKNRYIQRSFIMNIPSERSRAVELKLSPVVSEIQGKNILLVDDSIVRGTTLRRIIQIVKKAGAKKVYVATTCPPIRYGCFYGIDFPDPSKLIAKDKSIKEIETELGADGIFYLSVEDLKSTLGPDKLCVGCLTGEYPTSVTSGEAFSKLRNQQEGI